MTGEKRVDVEPLGEDLTHTYCVEGPCKCNSRPNHRHHTIARICALLCKRLKQWPNRRFTHKAVQFGIAFGPTLFPAHRPSLSSDFLIPSENFSPIFSPAP